MSKGNLPIVAIVGRPNVGKSALFNRLVGEPISIVEDQPGVTRDRIYAETTWNGRDFELVDTAGMILDESEATVQRGKKGKPSFNLTHAPQSDRALRAAILEHARVAVEESTIVLFLVDGLAGVHGLEEDIATMLRKSRKPVMLVVNKLDNLAREVEMADFYRLALGEPWPVSALHGLGTGELLDEVVRLLPPAEVEEVPEGIKLAIVGRPNVGKSSLLNTLLGEERAIVDDVPGTTRDPLDTRLEVDGEAFVLIDTAGLRRRARIDDKVEYYSGVRSLRAIARCDIAMLVIDAEEGVLAQDKRVAGHIQEESKAVIVLVNKWDRIRSHHGIDEVSARRAFARDLAAELNFMTYAPVLFVSAQTEEGLEELFPLVRDVYAEYSRRIETAALNRVVQEAAMMRPAPTFKGEQLKIFFASQKGVQPPEFVFKVNSIHLLHFSYKRYLENHIRRAFGLMGTPIRLTLKPKGK